MHNANMITILFIVIFTIVVTIQLNYQLLSDLFLILNDAALPEFIHRFRAMQASILPLLRADGAGGLVRQGHDVCYPERCILLRHFSFDPSPCQLDGV